ncbi:MAG: hypothetical protein HDKAJFGB_00435 [Anaerolineae bacterium]|nr:hypothetical protein [Anaerolineae bacterium]
MSRTFYTERDIEELAKRGVAEVEVNDSVYITDVAREMMDKLGIRRRVSGGQTAASSVLASPDVAHLHAPPAAATVALRREAALEGLSAAEKQEVIDKVKSGVLARLGSGVDAAAVEQIVRRVVDAL